MKRPKNLQDAVAAGLGFRNAKQANALPPRCFKQVEVTVDNNNEDDPYPTEEDGNYACFSMLIFQTL